MMAQRIDLLALQEIVIASALPKPIPTLAASEAAGVAFFPVSSVMSFVPPFRFGAQPHFAYGYGGRAASDEPALGPARTESNVGARGELQLVAPDKREGGGLLEGFRQQKLVCFGRYVTRDAIGSHVQVTVGLTSWR